MKKPLYTFSCSFETRKNDVLDIVEERKDAVVDENAECYCSCDEHFEAVRRQTENVERQVTQRLGVDGVHCALKLFVRQQSIVGDLFGHHYARQYQDG